MKAPDVTLGSFTPGSIAPAVFALVHRGALLRPELASEIAGRVDLALAGHPAVAVEFRGARVEVGDADAAAGAPALVIEGSLGDVCCLLAAPLTAGVPRPTSAWGRAGLARLADGRVALRGPAGLGRSVLRLLSSLD